MQFIKCDPKSDRKRDRKRGERKEESQRQRMNRRREKDARMPEEMVGQRDWAALRMA